MFTDKNGLAPPATYISSDLAGKYRAAILKAESLRNAFNQGLEGVTLPMVDEAENAACQILVEICESYTREAVRNGSIYDKYDLPQIFRNESGKESPGDIKVIEEIAAARGQVLTDG